MDRSSRPDADPSSVRSGPWPRWGRVSLSNAKYGPDPGPTICSVLSGQHGSFASSVIGATTDGVPHVLDRLPGNAAAFTPAEHCTDTGGVSDHVFALFKLPGLCFVPRIRDIPDRKRACFGRAGSWPGLASLPGRPIDEDVHIKTWDDMPHA